MEPTPVPDPASPEALLSALIEAARAHGPSDLVQLQAQVLHAYRMSGADARLVDELAEVLDRLRVAAKAHAHVWSGDFNPVRAYATGRPGYWEARAALDAAVAQVELCRIQLVLDDARRVAAAPRERSAAAAALLTDEQKRVYALLANRCRSAKELARELGSGWTAESVRKIIERIRGRGVVIENKRGSGYYRPDAPPISGA